MHISSKQIAVMMMRREKYQNRIRILTGMIDGTNEPATVLTGPNMAPCDKASRDFAHDVVDAYNAYAAAASFHDYGMTPDQYFDAYFFGAGKDDSKGFPSRLDKWQNKLVVSMICCCALMAVSGPGFTRVATVADVKENCRAFLELFSREGRRDEVWRKQIEDYVLSGETPHVCTSKDLAERILKSSNSAFPTIETDGRAFKEEGLEDSFRCIFEVLSGKPFVSLIPPRKRKAFIADASNFRHLKDEESLIWMSRTEAELALEAGWIDERDIAMCLPIDAPDPFEIEEYEPAALKELMREKERIEQWALDFPYKKEWCKHYAGMYEAFFALNGINPMCKPDESGSRQEFANFDKGAWASPCDLWVEQLLDSFNVVLDARGIAHYSDDVFIAAYDGIQRATLQAQRQNERGV